MLMCVHAYHLQVKEVIQEGLQPEVLLVIDDLKIISFERF